jgi:acetyl esterase/lipase
MGRSRIRLRSNISYGPAAGRANLLDLYLPRDGEVTGPTLIYLHGGRFKIGDKRREAQAIKCRLARRGWAVISANYQLVPAGTFPDYLIDLKRVINWARTEGRSFGIDPDRVFLSGGSAGAHISSMAALTPDRADLQPGFEGASTEVSGVIGLYGYYGSLKVDGGPIENLPSGPRDHVHPEAPPFLLIHGDHDSVMGPATAGELAEDLKEAGNQAALAILPGAQHSFDLLRSVRTENTIDAIEDFAAWAQEREKRDEPALRR